ncbi:SGNH hydrolase-type esterase domain-containing protein [Lophiotrema nucula]|uniref:SGNH hydrolase-type esterase domain-containing protein n=1 Tax=Lophiotrema nucula TaxID=690887 RepID=A0A6A5YGA2_9PLEO|nr:SGNH hydrolase-type esterase domain-containing protein [Lophiotrema nucula]
MAVQYDQFFLFGDSITQQSFDQERGFGFSAALQHYYIRRLDVVNRGHNGYTSRQALKVLPLIIPSPSQARIRFFVLFFGANDASLPNAENKQHVPLEEYKDNLKKIVTHPLVTAHNPRVILVAPPPVNEHLFEPVNRVATGTRQYAEAVVELGKELDVPVVNLWNAFMAKTGWEAEKWKIGDPIPGSLNAAPNDGLVELMYDGLHFNPSGYDLFFQEVKSLIENKFPDQTAENLPMVLPAWNDLAAWEWM